MIGLERVGNSQIARPRLASLAAPVLECAPHLLPTPSIRQSAIVQNLSCAQELLDRLENAGHAERQLRILGERAFEVSWK